MMTLDLYGLHFLRPLWLLPMLFAVILPVLWRGLQAPARGLPIAPALLRHLLVKQSDRPRLRPVHLLAVLLALGALAAAGPAWEQQRPAFLEDQATLILAIDLSASMDADDVPPSRLTAARDKFHDLVRRHRGARIGLIAYAGSAHLVLPPTDDAALLDSFIQVLSTDLVSRGGKNVLAVIALAKRLVGAEPAPATLLIASDGADRSQLDDIRQALAGSNLQVLILAVGRRDTGVLHDARGDLRLDAKGKPAIGAFDEPALRQLADALDAPIASLTANNDDLDWVEHHTQRHFRAANVDEQALRWRDMGYWLCWPLLVLAFLAVRRGWSLNWTALMWLGICLQALPVSDAQAEGFTDAFLTADQQGRLALERGRLPQAVERFHDPYWKGRAAYLAADYPMALASFARVDNAEGWFYLGNTYMRLSRFADAVGAYRHTLHLQPGMAEAEANLKLALALELRAEQQRDVAPQVEADEVSYDKPKGKGRDARQEGAQVSSEERWLENLSTSPAQFLQRKFAVEDAQAYPETTP